MRYGLLAIGLGYFPNDSETTPFILFPDTVQIQRLLENMHDHIGNIGFIYWIFLLLLEGVVPALLTEYLLCSLSEIRSVQCKRFCNAVFLFPFTAVRLIFRYNRLLCLPLSSQLIPSVNLLLLTVLLQSLCFKSNISLRLFLSIICQLFWTASEKLSGLTAEIYLRITGEAVLSAEKPFAYLMLFTTETITYLLIFTVLVTGMLRLHRTQHICLERKEFLLITAALLFYWLLILGAEQVSGFYLSIAAAVTTLLLLAVVLKMNGYAIHEQERKMLAFQLTTQEEEISQLGKQYETLSILRHDYRNQIQCAIALLQDEQPDAALTYLQSLASDKLNKHHSIVQCSSPVIRAVINAKIEEAHSQGIDVCCCITTQIQQKWEYDISIVLFNLMDNAIAGCSRSDKSEIHVNIIQNAGYLYLTVKNPVNAPVNIERGVDPLHGWGLRSVKAIAAKYSGEVILREKKNIFSATVALPI